MGKYSLVIDDMVWSNTRLNCFEDCKYEWYLRYIDEADNVDDQEFFASYGNLMHKCIADFFSGRKSRGQVMADYVLQYEDLYTMPTPSKVSEKYFEDGFNYLRKLEMPKNKILEIEQKYRFNLDYKKNSIKLVGVIDMLEEDENGNLILIDHKTSTFKPRSGRKKPTKRDLALDKRLRQLYLYSIPICEKYGRYPSKLCFNVFRDNRVVEEPFKIRELEKTKEWVRNEVKQISEEETFPPNVSYFYCRYLCKMHNECEHYKPQ